MSYILEALSKAEQARLQIVAAPGYSLLPVMGEQASRRPRWPHALVAAVVVNAAVLYFWTQRASDAPVRHVPLSTRAIPAGQKALVDAPARQEAPPLKIVNEPVHMAEPPRPRIVRPPVSRSLAAADPAPKTMPARPVSADKAATTSPVSADKAASAPAAEHEPAGPGEQQLSKIQQELPALSVAGFIRGGGSDSMVIVNDKLFREGDEVSAGVKLEKIFGDSVVFNYKGYRFVR